MTEEARIPKEATEAAREFLAEFGHGDLEVPYRLKRAEILVRRVRPALRKAIEGEIRERLLSDGVIEAMARDRRERVRGDTLPWSELPDFAQDKIRAGVESDLRAAFATLEEKQ